MKIILICLGLLLAGLAAGAGAAWFMPAPAPDTETAPPEARQTTAPAVDNPSIYIDIHNQFVVPVVEQGNVAAMVVITLSLEVDATEEAVVRAAEPRLRDQFLQVFFNHANAGKFGGIFTAPAVMGELRHSLLTAAQDRLGPAVRDVLIVDMVRQDG